MKERDLIEAMGPLKVRRTGAHSFCAVLEDVCILEHGRVSRVAASGSSGPDAIFKLFNDLTNLRATQKLIISADRSGRRGYTWNGRAFVPD